MGNYVAIEHKDGLTTLYAHNHRNLVEVGQTVEQGEVIGFYGSTGQYRPALAFLKSVFHQV